MSDNTLTGCWRLEQVGQHSSDEDDLFSSMKSRRSAGTGEIEGYLACVSRNTDLLSSLQTIKKLSLKLNTGLPASAACERLIAVHCNASWDELYSPRKSAAAQTQQEVCRLMLKRWTQVK